MSSSLPSTHHPPNPTPQQSQNNLQQFNRFLHNNNQLLQQKYKQHFKQDKIKIIQGKEPKIQVVVNFVADVFSFQGEDGVGGSHGGMRNQKGSIGMIRDSLRNSYESFMKRNKDLKEFTVEIAIQLLRFCIQSNQMFAVQYQSTKQPTSSTKKQSHPNNNNTQPQSNHNNNNQHNNPNISHNNPQSYNLNSNQFTNPSSNYPNHNNNPDTTSNNNNNSQQNSNSNTNSNNNHHYPHSHSHHNNNKIKNRNSFDDGQLLNQFNFHQEIKLDLDPGIIKKNIKIIFDYYCKQQMCLAPNLSFDRIERQSHMMTLGKILLMARMMNMFNGIITKHGIINKFRKISEGKKQIDYKKFDILMNQLQIQDPTLIARSEIHSPNIQAYLKTTKKPFDTQDMLPRQIIKKRNFTNKLTLHSGKMEADLIQDLKIKRSSVNASNISNVSNLGGNMEEKLSPKQSRVKMMEYYDEISQKNKQKEKERQKQKERDKDIIKLKQMQYMSSMMRRQSQIIGPQNLRKLQRNHSHDLSLLKIKKIITVEQQDDKWLNQYKINNSIRKAQAYDDNIEKKRSFQDKQRNSILIRDLKNRVKQMEINQAPSSFDQTKPYLISPTRRY